MYEINLTPSTKPMTYRQDILEADFVLLIMKNNYGTPTDSGVSGTHEEYKIAKENNIPMHVYLKNNLENNSLIEELNKDSISYYYFNSDNDLIERIKETTFIIAKEIMLNQISNSNLSESVIRKLTYNHDYSKGLEIIKIIEIMKKYNDLSSSFDYYTTTTFTAFLEPIIETIKSNKSYFINERLNKKINVMLKTADNFSNYHTNDYITNVLSPVKTIEILGLVSIFQVDYHKDTELSQKDYEEIIELFFEQYIEFRETISSLKLEADMR